VNVADLAGVPFVKEMLAAWLYPVQERTVDTHGAFSEPALRAGDADRAPNEQLAVVFCNLMNRVAFRHASQTVRWLRYDRSIECSANGGGRIGSRP